VNLFSHPQQHIHFVGIGGIGLSAIARILLERGFKISGSDRATNSMTDALARDGATIYEGHNAAHIQGADMVIVTSAVQSNSEIAAAQAADIPVYKRRDMMAALMQDKYVIAVAGTAGKTTTTALITHLLREGAKDPSYIVGGVMANTGTNAGNGTGKYFVVEADEYDNMFHGLRPNLTLITNIDYDHPDFFKTESDMFDSFRTFAEKLEAKDDVLLVCADNPGTRRLYQEYWQSTGRGHTYGVSDDPHYRVQNIHTDSEDFTVFDVEFAAWTDENGKPSKYYPIGTIRSPLAGTHNVQNVLGAIVVANRFCNIPFVIVAQAVETFQGTGRRFELLGEVDGIVVIDDYAHHPSKIRATLQATRSRYPNHEIWAVWQPHTYSRTQTLMNEFVESFTDADHVIVTEIYAARENPVPGVDGAAVASQIAAYHQIYDNHKSVNFSANLADSVALLLKKVKNPAVIVVMSAGDASKIGHDYLAQRQSGA
jgi:UDP-N-acetylmuramate--alanine ligase